MLGLYGLPVPPPVRIKFSQENFIFGNWAPALSTPRSGQELDFLLGDLVLGSVPFLLSFLCLLLCTRVAACLLFRGKDSCFIEHVRLVPDQRNCCEARGGFFSLAVLFCGDVDRSYVPLAWSPQINSTQST